MTNAIVVPSRLRRESGPDLASRGEAVGHARGLGSVFVAAGSVRRGQDLEQLADALLVSDRVGQRQMAVNCVVAASSVSLARDVAAGGQRVDDPVCRAFSDPQTFADVTQTDTGIVGDADQNLRVLRQKCPLGLGALSHEN